MTPEWEKFSGTGTWRWVRRSANGLEDRIANEGVDKEGPELGSTWSKISNSQFQINCTQLAENDYDGSQCMDEHIEDEGT
jgi:hypothetical protein